MKRRFHILAVVAIALVVFVLASFAAALVTGAYVGFLAAAGQVPPGFSVEEMLTSPDIETGPLSDLHFATAGVLFIANGLIMAVLAALAARFNLGAHMPEAMSFRPAPFTLNAGAIAIMPLLLVAGFIVAYAIFGINVPAERGLDLSAALPWLYVVGLVVAAPLGEEIAFRGYLQGGVTALTGRPALAVVMSGIVWALIHVGQGLPKALALIPVGLALGYLRARSNSLWPGLLGHMAMNATGLAFMVWLARGA